MKTDVLIIGAGPTGLMMANQLQRFGIDFIIMDSKEGPTEQSRAIAVTARSMEIYQQMGLSDHILDEGTPINSFNLYFFGKKKAEIKINEIGKGLTDFSFLFAFEQSKNEQLLYENLLRKGNNVIWNTEFSNLTQTDNDIVTIAFHNDDVKKIKSQYVVACDGAKSPIRHQLNFTFEGGTYENKFYVADTVLDWILEYDKLIIAPTNKNFCGFFPLKGERKYRVLGTLPKEFHQKENLTFKEIENEIKKTLGLPLTFEKINWFSVYNLHHRKVNNFRNKRVFLAGDSAHIHSPAGGQGMNTGLQDAYNLAWKLAYVLKDFAKEEILETYNEERIPFAKWLMRFTDRAFNIMTSDKWHIALFRKTILIPMIRFVLSSDLLKPTVFKTVSQIRYSYNGKKLSVNESRQKLKFDAGDRLPYKNEKGYYSQFSSEGFYLLHINDSKLHPQIEAEIKSLTPFPVTFYEDSLSMFWRNLGVTSELFILLRPDNYMGYLFDGYDTVKFKNYISRYFNVV
ncbi:FAD-dependent monooxygenase [Flavobacterium enshiense]|uniref:FAD-dependent monooxygenase n=1 Tax=Flavobacterium enshiense TaxID=1341165 RepID=UPI00345D3BFF